MTTSNTANIFLSELFTALDYVERAYFVLLDLMPQYGQEEWPLQVARRCYGQALAALPGVNPHPGKKARRKKQAAAKNAPNFSAVHERPMARPVVASFKLAPTSPAQIDTLSLQQIRQRLQTCGHIYEAYLELEPSLELNHLVINFINLLYQHAYELHRYLYQRGQINLEYPRSELAHQTPPLNEAGTQVVQFSLDPGLADELEFNSLETFLLCQKRQEKYHHYLQSAQRWLHLQRPEQALPDLQQALRLQETAEALTLMAQVYAQKGELLAAQNLCQKAIQLDDQYGPSYNDLGVYLMNQGQLEPALRWLQAAKKALHYEHREYPYINCGKIYLAWHDPRAAYEEFAKALSLVPHDLELQKMTQMVQNMLHPLPRPRNHQSFAQPSDLSGPPTPLN